MTYHVEISDDGRTVVFPAEIVQALAWQPGSSLEAEIDGSSLRVTRTRDEFSLHRHSESLDRLRETMKGYSLDDFLRDRQSDGGG